MEFLTVRDMNDRLTHNHVTESAEQHKYARLADVSYYHTDTAKVEAILREFEETRGFVRDTQLSNDEAGVYYHETTGEVVMSFRGTSNAKDVGTDLNVAVGREASTRRYRDSDELFQKTRDKYPGTKIVTTGHSLGGGISLHVA